MNLLRSWREGKKTIKILWDEINSLLDEKTRDFGSNAKDRISFKRKHAKRKAFLATLLPSKEGFIFYKIHPMTSPNTKMWST